MNQEFTPGTRVATRFGGVFGTVTEDKPLNGEFALIPIKFDHMRETQWMPPTSILKLMDAKQYLEVQSSHTVKPLDDEDWVREYNRVMDELEGLA